MEEGPLTRESRHAVLSNEIPAIRIRNFASGDECRAFSAAVEAVGYKFYSVARKIGYIGLAQYEYRWDRPKADYFRDAEAAYEQQQALISRSFDAVQRLMDTLQPLDRNSTRLTSSHLCAPRMQSSD